MGLKCRITYSEGVAQVIDDKGNESQLYNELLAYTNNEAEALNYWAIANDERFMGTGESTTIKDIVTFMDSSLASKKRLSTTEEFQVVDFMRRTGVKSLDELNMKMSKIFKSTGVFNIDANEAVSSGLFTQQEIDEVDPTQIQDILLKIEGQLSIRDILVEPEAQTFNYINSDIKTVFGTSQKVSQREFDNDIIRAVDSFTDSEAFLKGVQTLPYSKFVQRFQEDEEYASSIMEKFKGLKKIPKLTISGKNITDENTEVETTVKNTVLVKGRDIAIEAEIDYLNGIPQEIWDTNTEDIRGVLKEIEQSFADSNLDVVGIADNLHNRDGVMRLIYSADNILKGATVGTLQEFVESYTELIKTPNTIITEKLEDKYVGMNIVSLHTSKDADALFTEHGLIEIGENLYHKVDQNASIDILRDFVYDQFVEGSTEIPAKFISVKDIKDPQNKPAVLEGVSAYLMSRPIGAKITNKESYSAYQVAFDHNEVQSKETSVKGLSEIKTDEKYLKSEFISDFYNYILNEKVKNSEIYRNVLSKFQVNDRGITLTEAIPSIKNLEYEEELSDYIRLHRDSNMKYLVDISNDILSEDLLYLNFPERAIEFEGAMIVDGNFVITNPTVDNYIQVRGELYRKEIVRGNADLFVKINTAVNNVYLTNNLDFSFDRESANKLFNEYAMLSPTAVSHTSFQTTVAKSRLNDNMSPEFKELSTLKDKSYIFLKSENNIVVHKDGKEVGSLSYSNENGVYTNPRVSVSESHRSKGIGTELYLHLFNKVNNEGATVLKPKEETLQSKNIFSRVNQDLVNGRSTQEVMDRDMSVRDVDRLRTAIRNKDENSPTLEVLDEVSKAMKGRGFSLPYELEHLADEITLNDVGNLLREEEIVEDIKAFLVDRALSLEVNFQQGNRTEVVETPKQVLDAVLSKLKATELADNVYSMSAESLREEMEMMGIGVITINQVINEEEISEEGIEELNEAGVNVIPNGFVHNGTVFLNTDAKNLLNTQIHEFGHLFNAWAKENRPDIYKKGIDLIKSEEGKPYIDFVKKNQPNLEGEALQEEALTQAIGDRGQKFVEESSRKSFLEWLSELWDSVRVSLGIRDLSTNQVQKLDLEGFARAVATDMLKGNVYSTTAYTIQPLLDEMLVNKTGKMVNTQTIQQVLKQKGVKQIEKDIINEVLDLEGFKGQSKIPFDIFKVEVNTRIMPLTVIESSSYSDYGSGNVGVDIGWSTTNIYNTDLDHQIKGHFTGDFSVDLEASRFEVRDLQNGTYAVVREGVILTEENIQDNVVHATPNFESAENWIANYNKANATNQGMFGHTRVWRESGSKDVFVAEVQSDSYQNAKAEEMLFTSYKQDPESMTKEQKVAFEKYSKADNVVRVAEGQGFVDENTGKELFKNVVSLYNSIAEVMDSIRVDEKKLKGVKNKESLEAEVLETRLGRKRAVLDGYMKLAKGEKITLPEALEGIYTLPYNKITSRESALRLSFEVDGELVETVKKVNVVTTLEELSKGVKVGDVVDKISERLTGKTKSEISDSIAIHEREQNEARNHAEFDGAGKKIDELREELTLLKLGVDKTLTELKGFPRNSIIKSTPKTIYYLAKGTVSKENRKWVDGEYIDMGNTFSTPQKALDYYNNNIVEYFTVDAKEYEEFFNSNRDKGKYRKEVLEKASIKDKQFLAHRKNYSERLLREEIRSNALKGMETLSIPTPRTLSLIEGYTSEEGEGAIPYEIDGREEGNDADLVEGDTIEMHGTDYTVVTADQYDIEVVETDKVREVDGDAIMSEMVESDVTEAMYDFDRLISEKVTFTASEWQNWVSDEEYVISNLDIDEVGELEATDEDGDEVYLVNREKAEGTIRENLDRGQENVMDFMSELYPESWHVEDGTFIVTTSHNVYTEALKQPDQYEEVSIEDFDINDMNSSEQTVLKKYEELVETFKKENPGSVVIKDDKGNEWVRMELTSEAEGPMTVFQVGDNQSIAIEESIENTSSIFDSQLELVDLYSSKEEAQIKKDMDCG